MATNKKLHGRAGLPARKAAAATLERVIYHHASLETILASPGNTGLDRLDERDSGLANAIIQTTLRQRRSILEALSRVWDRPPPQKAQLLNCALETATAQIFYLEVPPRAAIDIAVEIVKSDAASRRFAGFANAVLRKIAERRTELLALVSGTVLFPKWMERRLRKDFGRDAVAAMSDALSRPADLDICTRQENATVPKNTIPLDHRHFRLTDDRPVRDLSGFDSGDWWIQNIAAGQSVQLLGQVAGLQVADLCAAPGGKTMQLASQGAHVTAVDISEKRMSRLSANLERTRLQAKLVIADLLSWQPEMAFDAILLDAPCTATGTVRRHPDILWNTREEEIDDLASLQKSMIEKAIDWLKPDGVLVYANCSMFRQEGEGLIANLDVSGIKMDPISVSEVPAIPESVNRQGTFRTLPHYNIANNHKTIGMDGFFAARLRKVSSTQ